jgi:hypothetical protein
MKVAHYFETSAVNIPTAQHNITGRPESLMPALRKRQISQRILFAFYVDAVEFVKAHCYLVHLMISPISLITDAINVASRRLARL